jgi:hypothetical protein
MVNNSKQNKKELDEFFNMCKYFNRISVTVKEFSKENKGLDNFTIKDRRNKPIKPRTRSK